VEGAVLVVDEEVAAVGCGTNNITISPRLLGGIIESRVYTYIYRGYPSAALYILDGASCQ
jgi:hypothetical protein